MENDTAAELARLDHVEHHLRRCAAFDETAQSELTFARELTRMRVRKDPDPSRAAGASTQRLTGETRQKAPAQRAHVKTERSDHDGPLAALSGGDR